MPPRLDLIDLDQATLAGYRRFISCWLSRGSGLTFVVDPGPASTAEVLEVRLRDLGVKDLDFILLTHIHLDHGGATSRLLEAFPAARVVCQKKSQHHLTAPARLWEGSRAVLGAVADTYGEPRPVPESALATYADLATAGIEVIPTPGHAPHHLSFLHHGTLFVGEAAGTFLDLGDHGWYLRPATPPRFFLATALASLDRLLALEPVPERLAFAHHGLLTGQVRDLLRASRDQHRRWVEVVRQARGENEAATFEDLAPLVVERLAADDSHFRLRDHLPTDIQIREQDFTRQALQGMVQFIEAETGF